MNLTKPVLGLIALSQIVTVSYAQNRDLSQLSQLDCTGANNYTFSYHPEQQNFTDSQRGTFTFQAFLEGDLNSPNFKIRLTLPSYGDRIHIYDFTRTQGQFKLGGIPLTCKFIVSGTLQNSPQQTQDAQDNNATQRADTPLGVSVVTVQIDSTKTNHQEGWNDAAVATTNATMDAAAIIQEMRPNKKSLPQVFVSKLNWFAFKFVPGIARASYSVGEYLFGFARYQAWPVLSNTTNFTARGLQSGIAAARKQMRQNGERHKTIHFAFWRRRNQATVVQTSDEASIYEQKPSSIGKNEEATFLPITAEEANSPTLQRALESATLRTRVQTQIDTDQNGESFVRLKDPYSR